MTLWRTCTVMLVVTGAASFAVAQDASVTPQLPATQENIRITPVEQPDETNMLSTHKGAVAEKPAAGMPAQSPPTPVESPPASTSSAPAPVTSLPATNPPSFAPVSKPAPFATMPKPMKPTPLPANVPFGHATYAPAETIPSAPHTTEAIPVGNVDAVEVAEPAPPTPVAPGADPASEDPTMPTNLTSPLFDGSDDLNQPRKIVLRVLNKVTAQSNLFKAKPGETVQFGRLEVTAVNCRVSAPTSQTDYAALLDIRERLPSTNTVKSLFHGWMYASSPSIAALEHPIYDVMVVSCDVSAPTPKEAPKPAKKGADKKK